jgi:hypothetical protein
VFFGGEHCRHITADVTCSAADQYSHSHYPIF